MRFSTGTQIIYGADAEGTAILMSGDSALRVVAPPPVWRLDDEKPDGRRTWRLPKGKALIRCHRPTNPAYFNALAAHLAMLTPRGLHPALTHGLDSEAVRLYPRISAAAQSDFTRLTAFLDKTFGVNASAWDGAPSAPFTDDIGPELLVLIDNYPVALPEMPPIYRAPAIWSPTMWTVANAMFGPYADDELPPEQQIAFMGVGELPNADSSLVEGLIYYQAARYITIFEAWVNNPDVPLLRKFIGLILDGQRPWQTNIRPLET